MSYIVKQIKRVRGFKKNDNYQGSADGLKPDPPALLLVLTFRLGPYLTILRWIKTYPIINWITHFIHFMPFLERE